MPGLHKNHRYILTLVAAMFSSTVVQADCIDVSVSDVAQGTEYTNCDGEKVVGTKKTLKACTKSGETSCLVGGSMYSISKTELEANLAFGKSLAGVVGKHESNFAKCSESGQVGCLVMAPHAAIDKVDAAQRIKSGTTIGGITGAGFPPCSYGGQRNCITNSSFPSASPGATDPYKLRAGSSYQGVAGKLKYCKSGAQISKFDQSSVVSNTARNHVYTVTVDSQTDLISGITANHFPYSGVRVNIASTTLLPAPLSQGQDLYVIAASTTTVKVASTLALAQAGTAIDLLSDGTGTITLTVVGDQEATALDAIDDRNLLSSGDGLSFGGKLNDAPFGQEYLCSHDDWEPLAASTNGTDVVSGTLSNCDDSGDQCILMDKMTRVIWTELTPGGTTGLTHAESQKACLDLSFANYTDWRLPDQNELIQAFINTIGGLETTYTGFGSTNNVTWSSTSRSNATIGWQGTKESWHMNLYTMAADYTDRTNTTRNYRCVRDAN